MDRNKLLKEAKGEANNVDVDVVAHAVGLLAATQALTRPLKGTETREKFVSSARQFWVSSGLAVPPVIDDLFNRAT